MKYYLIVLLSALFMAISGFFNKKSTALIGAVNTSFYYYLFGLLFASIVWFFSNDGGKVPIKSLVYPGLAGATLFISVLTFTFALKHINYSLSAALRSTSFLFAVIIGFFFLKENLTVKQLFGAILGLLSIFLLTT